MPLPRYSCKTQTRSILAVPSPRSWRRQVPIGNPSSTILMLLLSPSCRNVNFEHRAPLARKKGSTLTGI